MAVLYHPTDVQVFHTDHIEVLYERGCEFVQVVHPRVRNTSVKFRNAQAGTFSSLATLSPSCHNPLCSSELFLQPFTMSWVWYPSPVGEGSEAANAQIDPDNLPCLRQLFDLFIKNQSHKISSSTILGYRNRGGRACKCSGPTDLELTELSNDQTFVEGIPFKSRLGVLGSLFPIFLLEGWVSRFLFKEVVVGCLEMAKNLLSRYTRDIIQPGYIGLAFQLSQSGRRGDVVDRFPRTITICAKAQGPIVDVAARAKDMNEQNLLLISRIKPESVTELHIERIACVTGFVKLSRNDITSQPKG